MNRLARPAPRVGFVVAAAVLTLASMVLVWAVAVPSGPLVCPAVYPAPTNCRTGFRIGTAVVASIVIGVACLVTVAAALRRPAWEGVATGGILVLVAAPFLAYALVTGLPGFVLG